MYELLDIVVLARDIPEKGLRSGDLGAVVEVYDSDNFEAEFVAASGRTQALLALTTRDIRSVRDNDLVAVRELKRDARWPSRPAYAMNPTRLGTGGALHDAGAEPQAKTAAGAMPLHRPAEFGHLGVVRLLLERGVEVRRVGRDGCTALELAQRFGHAEVAALLGAAGPPTP